MRMAKSHAKKQKMRKSPINVASNPLPESPVSLAHGSVVPHVIFNRRAYSFRTPNSADWAATERDDGSYRMLFLRANG
jgi:hypothetical protein